MTNVWKLAFIFAGGSLALPIIAVIGFVLQHLERFGTQKLLFLIEACGTYSVPPILTLLALVWANPLKSNFPLCKHVLWISLIVAGLSPVLITLLVSALVIDSQGVFSILQDYPSFWYGHAAPGFFILLLQSGGIVLLVVILGISQFLRWLDHRRTSSHC